MQSITVVCSIGSTVEACKNNLQDWSLERLSLIQYHVVRVLTIFCLCCRLSLRITVLQWFENYNGQSIETETKTKRKLSRLKL